MLAPTFSWVRMERKSWRLAGGTGGGEEVTSASTYLQLGKDGEKATEPWCLAGGTGGGEGGDQC
jgi:hypothetical protein